MSDESVESFFSAMVAYVRLADDGAGALAALALLGPSPSGEARLALYQRLLSRQREVVIEGFYPATQRALGMVDRRLWPAILREFCDSTEPDSPFPIDYAGKFASYVERAVLDSNRTLPIPSVAAELTDYEWLCVAVTRARGENRGEGVSWHIREYTRNISGFVRLSAELDSSVQFPEDIAETIVVFCSSSTLRAQVMPVTADIMLALASRVGHALPSGVPPERIAQIDQQLTALGVH